MSDFVKKVQVLVDNVHHDIILDDISEVTLTIVLDRKYKKYVQVSRRYKRGLKLIPTEITQQKTFEL